MVKAGIITSSPFPIPKAARVRCKAAVPLFVDTAYLVPTNWANLFSNFSTNGPFEEIQPLLIAISKYFFAFLEIRGLEIGMFTMQFYQIRLYFGTSSMRRAEYPPLVI